MNDYNLETFKNNDTTKLTAIATSLTKEEFYDSIGELVEDFVAQDGSRALPTKSKNGYNIMATHSNHWYKYTVFVNPKDKVQDDTLKTLRKAELVFRNKENEAAVTNLGVELYNFHNKK